MMVGTIQIISIGNKYCGPLNQKKGRKLRGLWIYHSIDKETNPPQATTEMIISFTVMTYGSVLTSVDSNDIPYSIMHLFHYYVNTVQYITYSGNTVQYITGVHVQYITVVHYLVHKYCTVLMSVDCNDNLYRNTVQYITVVDYVIIT